MTVQFDHDFLRRELRAAADSLEPRDDGLERIRARLRQPRSASARLRALYGEIVMRTPTWLQDVVYGVADWIRLVIDRFAPAQTPGRHRSRTQGLLRPLAAMAVVMFIVAAGTYVAIDASTAIFPSSSSSQPGGPNAGGHSRAAAPGPSHQGGGNPAPAGSGRTAASPSCSTTPKPGQTTSAPAPPAPSASPSASPADTSASVDASPSPSDSSTTSPAPASPAVSPAASANVQPSQAASAPATKPC